LQWVNAIQECINAANGVSPVADAGLWVIM
jgi:hypothetical protein